MGGVRPQEWLDLIRALDEESAAGREPVLATAISLDGSVFERSGAAVLLSEGPGRLAVCPSAHAPSALAQAAREAQSAGTPRLCEVDLAEDDHLLGYGMGAPGRLEVLLEPCTPALRGSLRELRDLLLEGRGVVLAVELTGPEAGRRSALPPEDPRARECYEERSAELIERVEHGAVSRTFLCPLHPMGKAVVFGSSSDAAATARHLAELGFLVWAADPRAGALRQPEWDRLHGWRIEGGWEQARSAAGPDEDTAIVVMTHSYALDLETLQGALQSPAPYVGLVGPARRTQRLLAELSALGVRPRPGVLRAPAGLDLGAVAPREVALAVAAEILAVRWGRRGGRQSQRVKPTGHMAAPARPKVPGLVLAAGKGERFEGGSKLAADFGGRPVLRHAVEHALASRLDPVIVVLGHGAEAGLRALEGLDDPRLRVVFNPRWEAGKGSSIEVGLREVPAGSEGVVTLLGDMPSVKPWLIDRVAEEFELSGRLAFPVFPVEGGQARGFPAAFPRSLFPEIAALSGDDTALDAVRAHWNEAVKVPLEDASTQVDVNTAQDLQLLKGE